MATLIQSAQGLSDKVTANEEALEQLQTDLEEGLQNASDGINANTNAIVDLEDHVTKNEQDIALNTAEIETNKSEIASNEAAITQNTSDIQELKNNVNVVEGNVNYYILQTTPVGGSLTWSGKLSRIPYSLGFLLKNGAMVAVADYPALFEEVGYTYLLLGTKDKETGIITGSDYILTEDYTDYELDTEGNKQPIYTDRFRLPNSLDRYSVGAGGVKASSESPYVDAAIPNLKGIVAPHHLFIGGNNIVSTDPFYSSGSYGSSNLASGGSGTTVIRMDASRSSSVYSDDATTIDPDAIGEWQLIKAKDTSAGNQLVEEVLNVNGFGTLVNGDPVQLKEIQVTEDSTKAVVKKCSDPKLFRGIVQGITDGVLTDIKLHTKGIVSVTAGAIGDNVYLDATGNYTVDINNGIYFIGQIVATANLPKAIYLSGLTFVGSNTSISNSVLDTITNSSATAVSIQLDATVEVSFASSNYSGSVVNYDSTNVALELLDPSKIHKIKIEAQPTTYLSDRYITVAISYSDTANGTYTLDEDTIQKLNINTGGASMDAYELDYLPKGAFIKVLARSPEGETVSFADATFNVNGSDYTVPFLKTTITRY